MLVNCGSVCEEAHFCRTTSSRPWEGVLATIQKLHFPASARCQNYLSRKPERDSSSLALPPAHRKTEAMWSRGAWRLLLSESSGDCRLLMPCGRFSPALRRGEKGPVSPMPEYALGRRCSCPLERAGVKGATPSSPACAWLWRPCCRVSPRKGEDCEEDRLRPLRARL